MMKNKVVVLEEYKKNRKRYTLRKKRRALQELLEDISAAFLLYSIPIMVILALLAFIIKAIIK